MPATFANRLDQRLDWAREQVGVAPGASLEAVRRRFLAALAKENFVPDEGLDRAFRTLRWEAEGVIDADDPPEFVKTEEQRLQEEVEKFAGEMFGLPVAERRRRWAEVYRRAEHSLRMRARLEALAPGLDADLNTVDDSARAMHVKTLARYAMELFPQRPTPRAVRRHALLQVLHKDDIKPWRQAAQRLKKKYPHLAALAPELIDQVAVAGTPPRAVQRAVQVTRQASSTRGTGWGLGLALCIFLSFIVRAAMQTSHTSPPTPRQDQTEALRLMQEVLKQQQAQNRGNASPLFSPPAAPPTAAPTGEWGPPLQPGFEAGPYVESGSAPFSAPDGMDEIMQKHREDLDRIRQENRARMEAMQRAASPNGSPGGPSRLQPTPPRSFNSPPGF
jgi:hypothetical protein